MKAANIPTLTVCLGDERQRLKTCLSLSQMLGNENIRVEILPFGEENPPICDLVLNSSSTAVSTPSVYIGGDNQKKEGEHFFLENDEALERLTRDIMHWLQEKLFSVPVWGCILIGGMSRRMGRPKHLIQLQDGRTWLEKTADTLQGRVDKVVVAGKGELPGKMASCIRLRDVDNITGPLAGILAAMRWNPAVSWIVSACDMPLMTGEEIEWLLANRCPGYWGIIPKQQDSGKLEPLLAHYDFRSRLLFEKLSREGNLRVSNVCSDGKILTPLVPLSIAQSWRNCNTPDDLAEVNV